MTNKLQILFIHHRSREQLLS